MEKCNEQIDKKNNEELVSIYIIYDDYHVQFEPLIIDLEGELSQHMNIQLIKKGL